MTNTDRQDAWAETGYVREIDPETVQRIARFLGNESGNTTESSPDIEWAGNAERTASNLARVRSIRDQLSKERV